jgi:hypothetical protein
VINKWTDLMIMNLQDADGGVPFYWGVDSGDRLVVSDDAEIVKKACGKSFAPFPKGLCDQQSNHLRYFFPQELGSFDPSKLMLPSIRFLLLHLWRVAELRASIERGEADAEGG